MLPLIQTPIYTTILPSNKKEIRFKPYQLKHQKSLMIAAQSEDIDVMFETLKSVINGCVVDNIDVDNLPTIDLEYLFIQLRCKSVGENIQLGLKCDDCEDSTINININLETIKPKFNPDHTDVIMITNDVGIKFKLPSLSLINKISKNENKNNVNSIIIDCIDYIFDSDQTYNPKETTREELESWIESLELNQIKNINKFFETLPKINKEIKYKCNSCNKEHDKIIEGIQSFF